MAGNFKDPPQFGNRMAVFVDSQLAVGILFFVHDQQRSRLLASLVPANRLAGLQGNHKPLGQVHALGTAEGFRHRLHRLLAHQHVTLRREVWPGDVSEPRHALRTRPGGAIPLAIHESDLSNIPARDRKSTRLNSSHAWISYAV